MVEWSIEKLEGHVAAKELRHEEVMWLGFNLLDRAGDVRNYRLKFAGPSLHPALSRAAELKMLRLWTSRKRNEVVYRLRPKAAEAVFGYFEEYGGKKTRS